MITKDLLIMKLLIRLAKITLIAMIITISYIVLNEFQNIKVYQPNNNYESPFVPDKF